MSARAEFSAVARRIIAERAGYQCSVLNCGRLTVGPGMGPRQTVNTGMAAHIYGASPNGPRGTGGLSVVERGEPENGIWCCFTHGKAIDSDNGRIYSASQLRAWKRLHEARKSAEVNGIALDRVGLVESISINSAPAASLEGRTFDLGMRNIVIGPNASGKTILTRLIASVAYPDHVAEMSRRRDVDLAVRWFDPHIHNVATKGRAGDVTHILDGISVPYVARPYKTVLLEGAFLANVGSIIDLAQKFDLSVSAMKAMLDLLAAESSLVREVSCVNNRLCWTLEVCGRRIESAGRNRMSEWMQSSIILELAGMHARYHARVEPTLLLIDGFLDYIDPESQIAALERLERAAEYAQVAVVGYSPSLAKAVSSGWGVTTLERRPGNTLNHPVDFEVATRVGPAVSAASQALDLGTRLSRRSHGC